MGSVSKLREWFEGHSEYASRYPTMPGVGDTYARMVAEAGVELCRRLEGLLEKHANPNDELRFMSLTLLVSKLHDLLAETPDGPVKSEWSR